MIGKPRDFEMGPDVTIDNETREAMYPGFRIACANCGRDNVIVDNTIGWSAESGAWGLFDLLCLNCGQTTTLLDPVA